MKILIVEDDPVTLKLMTDALSIDGHQVTGIDDGRHAVSVLRKERFDMIVSDVNLPYVGGFELYDHVKNQYPTTEFILYTSTDSPELEMLAMRKGIKNFFSNSLKNIQAIKAAAVERFNQAVDRNTAVTNQILGQ